MKKYLLLLLFAITCSNTFAQIADEEVNQLKKEVSSLKQQVGNQRSVTVNQQRKINALQSDFGKNKSLIDSLQSQVGSLTNALSSAEEKLGSDIKETNQTVENNATTLKDSISSKSMLGIILILVLAVLAGLGFLSLRKKVSNSDAAIDAVKDAQKKLEEESVKLDNQLVDILNNQLNTKPVIQQTTQSQPAALDHSLALKVADEIVRIETNISRMDPSVKGLSQLSKAVERIKDNFAAKGYNIADMLGKPYDEGMKIVADFVFDDTLPEGQRIISKVIKPQIVYNGQMIQAAQVTVKQNI